MTLKKEKKEEMPIYSCELSSSGDLSVGGATDWSSCCGTGAATIVDRRVVGELGDRREAARDGNAETVISALQIGHCSSHPSLTGAIIRLERNHSRASSSESTTDRPRPNEICAHKAESSACPPFRIQKDRMRIRFGWQTKLS